MDTVCGINQSVSTLETCSRLISPAGGERVQALQCNLKPQKTSLAEEDEEERLEEGRYQAQRILSE